MRLAVEPKGEARMGFVYPNDSFSTVEVWIAEPPACAVQDAVRVERRNAEPVEQIEVGGNLLQRFRVRPFRDLRIEWSYRRLESRLDEAQDPAVGVLSAAQRALYLEASPQVPRHPLIEAAARALGRGLDRPLELARAFYGTLVKDYQYSYPVARRGALEMLETRRGDCGQFCRLFVALGRSVGIPARAAYGALMLAGKRSPHAWVEFWIDGAGWVPADPTLGNAVAAARRRGVDAPPPEATFGRLGGSYFAFSLGFDLPLGDVYGDPVRPLPLPVRLVRWPTFGGRRLTWGYETVAGRVPHLQPAYPRSFPGVGLNALLRPSPVGFWTPRPDRPGLSRLHAFVQGTVLLLVLGIVALDVALVPADSVGGHAVAMALAVALVLWARFG
jgi:Transglutaminase-like superfamily